MQNGNFPIDSSLAVPIGIDKDYSLETLRGNACVIPRIAIPPCVFDTRSWRPVAITT
jgi:hypothetical protein